MLVNLNRTFLQRKMSLLQQQTQIQWHLWQRFTSPVFLFCFTGIFSFFPSKHLVFVIQKSVGSEWKIATSSFGGIHNNKLQTNNEPPTLCSEFPDNSNWKFQTEQLSNKQSPQPA